jgi:hypothetical protein
MRASESLWGAFTGSVTVLHSVLFLLSGINNTAALRAIAKIEWWIKITSGNDTISATRAIFRDSISSSIEGPDQHSLINQSINPSIK